jgi:hypothetical protein
VETAAVLEAHSTLFMPVSELGELWVAVELMHL